MKLSRKEKPDVLQLFLKKQEKLTGLSKFEEAFTFKYRIIVKMKRVVSEILQNKGIAYQLDSFDREESDKKKSKVDRFQLFTLEKNTVSYYKYTFLSKKEYYYLAKATHVANIEIINDKICEISLIDEEFFEDVKKISRLLNEYFETNIVIGNNIRSSDIENVYVNKSEIDELDKNTYHQFSGLHFLIKDIIVDFDLSKSVRFYMPSYDYGGY